MTSITTPDDLLRETVPQEEWSLEPIGFVATPRNFDEILAFTKGASTPADATIAAMMAWNLATKYAEHAAYHEAMRARLINQQGESHD